MHGGASSRPSAPCSCSSSGQASRRRPRGTARSRPAVRTGGRAADARRAAATTVRIWSAGTARTEWMAPPIRVVGSGVRDRPLGPAGRVAVAEPALRRGERLADPAGQVARVQQREPDAGRPGGLAQCVAHLRSGCRTACRPARGGRSGTRRRMSPRRAPSRRRRRSPAPRYESGSSRAATEYMCSRQVQNVPPALWVRPRRARWNACECALAKPGSTTPGSRASAGGARRQRRPR